MHFQSTLRICSRKYWTCQSDYTDWSGLFYMHMFFGTFLNSVFTLNIRHNLQCLYKNTGPKNCSSFEYIAMYLIIPGKQCRSYQILHVVCVYNIFSSKSVQIFRVKVSLTFITGQIQQTTNCWYFSHFPRKWDLTFHANCLLPISWKIKKKKKIKISSAENFTQSAGH